MKNFTLVADNQTPGVRVRIVCEHCGEEIIQRLQGTGHLQIDVDDLNDAIYNHVCDPK